MTTDADRRPFGAVMRELRMTAGLTQEELAERTGLSVRGISDLERGERTRPHFETVRLLADALELDRIQRSVLVAAARPATGAAPAEVARQVTVISGLPIPATRLIGREREIAEAIELLDRGEMRLLTLTGPGGVGKTRLALEVAATSVDAEAAVFVDLASINDTGLVATTIIRALGVRDPGDHASADLLKETLQQKRVLLVLDNFEHVIAARSLVGELLAACPQLKLLVTSRTPLRLRSEQIYPVPPLPLPDQSKQLTIAELVESPAVTLFIQRAKAADPHFSIAEENAQSVAEVCYRLDGLPLAIELAAARVKLLPPNVLLNLIKRRLLLLASGPQDAPERQQAMRSTLDWSYDLLSSEAQTLFRCLAVFAGGCTLEAIEAVRAEGIPDVLEPLTELSDHGFVQQATHPNGASRFRMPEVVHEYASELLAESGDQLPISRAHAAYYLNFTDRAATELNGPRQGAWLTQLIADEGNLSAALEFAITQQNADTALQLGGNLWAYWARRGYLGEGRMWLERALAIANGPSSVRTRALRTLGNLAIDLADYSRARSLFEAIRAESIELNDEDGIMISRNGLGLVAWYRGDYVEARALQEVNLTELRALGNRRREALALGCLGDIANALGHFEEARALHQEALAIQQAIGDTGGIAYSILCLAETACDAGETETAQSMFERSLVLFEDNGDFLGVAYARYGLGRVASIRQENIRASEQFAVALALRREIGDRRGIVECVEGLAGVAASFGESELAVRLFSATTAARIALGVPIPPVQQSTAETKIQRLRVALGEKAFASVWSSGKVMTIEQAASEAGRVPIDALPGTRENYSR